MITIMNTYLVEIDSNFFVVVHLSSKLAVEATLESCDKPHNKTVTTCIGILGVPSIARLEIRNNLAQVGTIKRIEDKS